MINNENSFFFIFVNAHQLYQMQIDEQRQWSEI